MAVKDFSGSENKDKEAKNTSNTKPGEVKSPKTNQQDTGPAEIKNAHATGDGSFGRSESSLPEKEDEEKRGSTY